MPASSRRPRARRRLLTPIMAWAASTGSPSGIRPGVHRLADLGGGLVDRRPARRCAARWRSLPRWRRSGTGGTSRDARRTTHGGPQPALDAADRVVGGPDRLALAPAEVLLGVVEDLQEQLILRVEVPVEDAFADAEAGDDLGHRGGVEAVLGEPLGGDVHELALALFTPPGQPRSTSGTVRHLTARSRNARMACGSAAHRTVVRAETPFTPPP